MLFANASTLGQSAIQGLTQSRALTKLRENTSEDSVGKRGKNPGNQHFLLLPQCFLSFLCQILFFFSHIYHILCKCFEFVNPCEVPFFFYCIE